MVFKKSEDRNILLLWTKKKKKSKQDFYRPLELIEISKTPEIFANITDLNNHINFRLKHKKAGTQFYRRFPPDVSQFGYMHNGS